MSLLQQPPRLPRLPVTPLRPLANRWRAVRRRLSPGAGYRVLGLCSTGHGASMALVSSDHPPRALQLERFCGRKNALLMSRAELDELETGANPIARGVRFLLSSHGQLPPILVFEEIWRPFFAALTRGLDIEPQDIDLVVASESHFALNRAWEGQRLSSYFPNAVVRTDLEHHAIHAFQAFYPSPFDRAAVLTADACGEGLKRHDGAEIAITLGEADGRRFQVFAEHRFPHSSPGLLYQNFNEYLGFRTGEEGKTMGLASYGTDRLFDEFSAELELSSDGSFRFLDNGALTARLGELEAAPRRPEEPILPIHQDVARAGQRLLEEVMVNAARALANRTPSPNLCLAGGVALNSVANERLIERSRFERLYVMPNAGDAGHALGCALHGQRLLLRRLPPQLHDDYLGPSYGEPEVRAALDSARLTAARPADLPERASELLESGRILAWFEGGSEFGPRALGHRSLFADCRRPDIQSYLNARVKHREPFRPYAPMVPEEEAAEWFELDGSSPYMLRVVDVRPGKRDLVPGITHVDGTARVQTVSRATHPALHRLLTVFGRRTGVPVLLNTSFNIAGRPIVETPADAVECFVSTAIDALAIEGLLVEKASR